MRNQFALTVLILGLGVGRVSAPDIYQATYHASFTTGYGGFPVVDLLGTYTFELLPPSYYANDGASAMFNNHLRTGSLLMNGVVFSSTSGNLRLDDNLPLNALQSRDGYSVGINLAGQLATNITLVAGGLGFESVAQSPPTALTSLNLPLSADDLAGFIGPGERRAFVNFYNLTDGGYYGIGAPVDWITISVIPEPLAGSIVLLAGGLLATRGHFKRRPAR
jgi:hypothetical protein